MEFHSLVDGKALPEVYHFGFDGAQFEIFLNKTYWKQFVDISGKGTYYASNQGSAHIPPQLDGGAFGQEGLALALNLSDDVVCIKIPAFVDNSNDDAQVSMSKLGRTLSSILFLLSHLLHEAEKVNDRVQVAQQLFVVETYYAPELLYHAAGLELSLSPFSRKYLENVGEGVSLDNVVSAMEEHYQKGQRLKTKIYRGGIEARLRTNGVLHMHTIGQCACLGTMPQDFGERGCHLSSHNVDALSQQFNLLVGIACIWQMVRDGIRMEQHTS